MVLRKKNYKSCIEKDSEYDAVVKEAKLLDIPTEYWNEKTQDYEPISLTRLKYAIKHCKKNEISEARKKFAELTDINNILKKGEKK